MATAIIWLPAADITWTSPVKGKFEDFEGVLDSVTKGLWEELDKSKELLLVLSDLMKDLSKTEDVLGTSSSGPVFFRESKMYK